MAAFLISNHSANMAAIPKNPPKPYPPGARSGHNRVRRRITALSHRFADRYLSRNDFSGSLYAAIAGATRSLKCRTAYRR